MLNACPGLPSPSAHLVSQLDDLKSYFRGMETNCRKLVSACVQLDSEIKKVEFTDSPESRKEAASSKLFPRQHPGANGKGEGSAGRAPGSRLRDSGPPVKPWRAKLLEPVCPRCRT
ncbi:hypothetical protein U0070_005864 [Myodes glareolus]|uniref:Uncharacterized protein n=1 Tax=Myodes glareolus TaxID=447135 RepID=A0AAW0IKD5_MYOGA